MFQALDEIIRILPGSSISSMGQEVVVFLVFLLSAWAWRVLRGWRPKRHADEKWSQDDRKVTQKVTPRQQARVESGPEQRVGVPNPLVPKSYDDRTKIELAHTQMMNHLDQKQFTLALNTFRMLEREGKDAYVTEDLYSAFCQSAIKVGKIDVMQLMLRAMRRNRVDPSLQFWHTLFKMLSSRKLFAECLLVHTSWGKLIPADSIIYSCLINAALDVGDSERALALISTYDQLDLHASNYILHFRTFLAANDVSAAEACFRKLGPRMTPLMLNLLLLTCIKANDPHRANKILHEAHDIEDAHQVSGIVDLVSYNTVLKGYVQAGLSTFCFECFKEMLEHSIEPDDITIGSLFEMSINHGKLNLATEMASLIIGRDAIVSMTTSTLFMKGLVRLNCLPKALEVYEVVRSRAASQPDIMMYSVLMRALADAHDLDKALELLGHMQAANVKPDDIILTHLLDACRHKNSIEKGKQLFEEIVAMGVTPSEFTLVALLKLHGRCGCQEEAFALLSSWEQKFGKAPSVIHFTCIITACIWCEKYDLAWAAFVLMRDRVVALDSMALTTLLQGLVAGAQWHRVVDLARHVLTAPGKSELASGPWNVALAKMVTVEGAGYHAKQLHQLMQRAHIPFTAGDTRQNRQ